MSILSLFYTVGFMSFISILSLSSLTNTTDSVVKLSIVVFCYFTQNGYGITN